MRFCTVLLSGLLAVAMVGCGGGGGGGSDAAGGLKITPEARAFFINGSQFVVGVPDGAVSSTVVATYSMPDIQQPDKVVKNSVIKFSPLTFAQPVAIHIEYVPAAVPAGRSESQLTLGRLTDAGWVEIPGSVVHTTTHAVDGFVSSFGTFGVIVKSGG